VIGRLVGVLSRCLAVSAAAGVAVAAMLLPVVGGAGLIAGAQADVFTQLPSELETPTLPQRSRILAADGSLLTTVFLNEDRTVVPLSDILVQTRQALVAIEDNRFYSHHGVDYRGLARALVTNSRSGSVQQGGSTLTQQYVKNVLVETAQTPHAKAVATAQTAGRKLQEARYALALEKRLTKDEILERYFNIAYFGQGVYGVGTAAQHYFGKPVDQLTLGESALLVGMVQNPALYDPVRHPDEARTRRGVVLDRMAALSYLPAAQAQAAARTPLGLHVTTTANGCGGATIAPFFCSWLLEEAQSDPQFGATREERSARLFQGGLTIRTTLDPTVQAAAQTAVDSTVPRDNRVGTAAVVVEPSTGRVKAMAVNRDYGADATKNQTMNNLATGGSSGFQAGSTFKVFVLAAALEQKVPLSLQLYAPQTYRSAVFTDNGQPYVVSNAGDSEAGTFDVVGATTASVNTYYIQLEERTGIDRPAGLAESMGLRIVAGDKPLQRVPSFTLGVNEVSPLAMAEAYATFAAHGRYCPARGIEALTDSSGAVVPLPAPACQQVMEPGIADTVTSVLTGVIDGFDPGKTGGRASIGRPAAGKTGTVENYSAAWFVGYTPELATAVWMGDPVGGFAHPLVDVSVAGNYYSHVYGGDVPAQIWQRTMSSALDGVAVNPFAVPPLIRYLPQPTAPPSAGSNPTPRRTSGPAEPSQSGGRSASATPPAAPEPAGPPSAPASGRPVAPTPPTPPTVAPTPVPTPGSPTVQPPSTAAPNPGPSP
jgi:membrane peptidoglycan carboxypeptidase